jgi:hypothetical protein
MITGHGIALHDGRLARRRNPQGVVVGLELSDRQVLWVVECWDLSFIRKMVAPRALGLKSTVFLC